MRLQFPTIALLFCVLLSDVALASDWTFRTGDSVAGEPVAFDFERKTLTFRDALSDRERIVPTRNLSLRSRQKLLFSSLFHRGDRDDPLWPPEKRRLLLIALAIPAAVLFVVFWFSAGLLTRKINPLLALAGFAGTWLILGIFAVCYSFLLIRFGGGWKIVMFGTAVSLAVTPLYLSAVYGCAYGRAQMALLSHLVAGFCVLALGLATIEAAAGEKKTELWWDTNVFEPLGLIAPADPPPREGP